MGEKLAAESAVRRTFIILTHMRLRNPLRFTETRFALDQEKGSVTTTAYIYH